MNHSALIVEDNKTLADAYTLTISDLLDYETVTISNGQAAMQFLQKNRPSLLLLDLHLPTVDGIEILEYLQRQPMATQMTILVLTADLLMGERVAEQFNIVSDILYKPFKLSKLSETIRHLTEQKQHA